MSSEYKIVSFNPIDASEPLLEAYLTFDDMINMELTPEQGLTSKDSRKKNLKILDPTRDNSYWLAVKSSNNNLTVIGYSRLSVLNQSSPAYEQNGHIAGCSILVISDYKNKKIGTNMLERVVEKALQYPQVTHLMFRTYNESGYFFLERKGAELVLEQNHSYLKISEVDWIMINDWNNKGHELANNEKIKMIEIEGSIPDDIIDEYASLYTEIMNQQPLGSLQLRNVTTPEVLRTRAEHMKKIDQHWHTLLTIEKNKQISGLTEFHYGYNQPDVIFQLLTGVKDEYRKRGIGKWLKAKMLLFMKEHYPDVKYIETTNTVTNAAMISINKRMGFKDKEPLKFYELRIR